MPINNRYSEAKQIYAAAGVDTDKAVSALSAIPLSMHCWQGDDIGGFENVCGSMGGIQATGNYPGKARNAEELMADIVRALSLIPGKHRLSLHANYAFADESGFLPERDSLKPENFAPWVAFAKERGLGLDFNATFFAHPKADVATLASEDDQTRAFWVRHAQACVKISEYFANELGGYSLMNIWIPDGFKDVPADRLAPRKRFKASLDEILSIPYDKSKVLVSIESKVFGIGLESYTVGSHEFCMNYAAKNDVLYLIDNGHFHPQEYVSDKISSMLLFYDRLALHVTRGVRWDSDHVIRLDDETKELAQEIIRNGAHKVLIGLDFFDASINRIAAWVIGMRNMQKALLNALLTPHEKLAQLQNERRFTELLAIQEELKLCPIGDVWNYFCVQSDVPTGQSWLDEIKEYEKDVQLKRV